ncbi:MAG: hypothetical protein WBG71_14360 [Leeuwenhoekiella sp.]
MDFKTLFDDLKTEIVDMVKDSFGDEGKNVKDDISLFIEGSKDNLERWIDLLGKGLITPEELELLLKSQKDLLIIQTLHKAGVSKIKVGLFKNAVIKLIVSKSISFIL